MEVTYRDVAAELTTRYRKVKRTLKKGEKQKAFLSILKSLFFKYGEYFDFDHNEFSAFKSAVINARNNGKKAIAKKETIKKTKTKEKDETLNDFKIKKVYHRPREGAGQIFTQWQVENLGLNPDSY
ncbi:MAG: hypothetical protein JJE53_02740 [Candidatus Pacebacteria bacterium]|nr:hypothetical protein [Candidatus Paceibacterota bacterium]